MLQDQEKRDLKLKCLELAMPKTFGGTDTNAILETADKYYQFITSEQVEIKKRGALGVLDNQ